MIDFEGLKQKSSSAQYDSNIPFLGDQFPRICSVERVQAALVKPHEKINNNPKQKALHVMILIGLAS